MTFDGTTFVLEIINFVILVWLLKRFFYQPLLGGLDRRREAVEAQRLEAEQLNSQANALKAQYDKRLEAWEQECTSLRSALHERIELERSQLLAQAHSAALAESEKVQAAAHQRLEERARAQEVQALQQGAGFAARLLQRLADPHLEARIIALFIDEWPSLLAGAMPPSLPAQSSGQSALLAQHIEQGLIETVTVTSAFTLDTAQRTQLSALLPGHAKIVFGTDPALVAGVRVALGSWVLQASIADELQLFSAGTALTGEQNEPA